MARGDVGLLTDAVIASQDELGTDAVEGRYPLANDAAVFDRTLAVTGRLLEAAVLTFVRRRPGRTLACGNDVAQVPAERFGDRGVDRRVGVDSAIDVGAGTTAAACSQSGRCQAPRAGDSG